MRPSHHLCSLVPSIPCSSAAISDRPSHDSSSASPSRKYRGTDLEMYDNVEKSDGIDIDTEIQAEIDECARGPVKVRVNRVTHPVIVDDILEPAQEEGAIEFTYETLGDLVQRTVATGQRSDDMLERIRELERDNMRLRDMMDVASQRVIRTMPNTRSGASRSCEGITQQIDRQMAGALGARTTVRNLEPLMRDGGGQEEVNRNEGNGNGGNRNRGNGNGGNRNGGNGNGNGNGGGNGYNFGGFVPARECTY
ncbi:hypothetical protein Tco_1436145, partial [Tanacetum coccineum]